MIDTPEHLAGRLARLSPRELDVARLAARGYSARYIADRYGLSARTIETHTRHVYEKLEIGHRDVLIERYADALLGDKPSTADGRDPERIEECRSCHGTGRINWGTRRPAGWSAPCPACDGRGELTIS